MLDEIETITGYDFLVSGRFLDLENKTWNNNVKEEKYFQNIPLIIFLLWPMRKLFD